MSSSKYWYLLQDGVKSQTNVSLHHLLWEQLDTSRKLYFAPFISSQDRLYSTLGLWAPSKKARVEYVKRVLVRLVKERNSARFRFSVGQQSPLILTTYFLQHVMFWAHLHPRYLRRYSTKFWWHKDRQWTRFLTTQSLRSGGIGHNDSDEN